MSVNKLAADRNQKILLELAALPGNDICADCKVRNPRWASYSLGIFICVNCASIHRKIGTHVSKVKSLTLDAWTKEQVDRMREMGNNNSNLIHNPNETRHPPPPNLLDGERDSEMEQFVRSKYEYKSFVDRSAVVASKLGPSRSLASMRSASPAASTSKAPPPRSNTTAPEPPRLTPSRSFTQPSPATSAPAAPPRPAPSPRPAQQPIVAPPQQQQPPPQPGGVWNDLVSLQTPAVNSSLPLQVQANPNPSFLQPMQAQPMMTGFQPQMPMQMQMATGMPMGMGMGMNMGMPTQYAPMPMQQQQPQYTAAPAAPIYNPQPQQFGAVQPVQPMPMYGGSPSIQITPSPVPMQTPSPGLGVMPQQQYMQQPMFQQPQQQQQQFAGPPMQQFMPQQQQPMGMPMQMGGPQAWMGQAAPNMGMGMGYMPQQQQQGQWGAM
uniref:ARF GAP-like zinc finger-containing protein n=1 Tax=Mycena chlorophos TaxID=658473 RepID=A0ABQ0LJT2_MYCCL|nr:ARF GAP-like zinc finger-containing protein [Mycena chlorophos]